MGPSAERGFAPKALARWFGAFACCAVLCVAARASAEPLRLHLGAGVGRAFTGYQEHELGFGASGSGAVELPLTRAFGFQLELNGLWLKSINPPSDPRIQPGGDATSGSAGFGVRLRPFVNAYAGHPVSAAGFWVAGAGGAARTGGLTRAMLDAELGFDFLYNHERFGIGPMLGYVHVFQPDDTLRPDDANIAILGVHVMFDTAPARHVVGDRDGDGIPDDVDKCPNDPENYNGYQDNDGCPDDPDTDRDGVPDSIDQCVLAPEDHDNYLDDDGCPDVDNDMDGIPDAKDKCPNQAEDPDGFQDEDGCPDLDNDHDGVPDLQDQCPNTPGPPPLGCPKLDVRVVGDKILLGDRIHFRTNSSQIRDVSFPLLVKVADLIKAHPEYVHIELEGHADERGPEWYNQTLSLHRAQSVSRFLVAHGVKRSLLGAKGFGSTQPLVDKRSQYAWFINRRVEFRVTRSKTIKTHEGATNGGTP
jgi:outer membrane protein OmpA-like peptidoglycan-associated protein